MYTREYYLAVNKTEDSTFLTSPRWCLICWLGGLSLRIVTKSLCRIPSSWPLRQSRGRQEKGQKHVRESKFSLPSQETWKRQSFVDSEMQPQEAFPTDPLIWGLPIPRNQVWITLHFGIYICIYYIHICIYINLYII